MATKNFLTLYVFLFSALSLHGQVSPAEGSTLSYRIIGFATPKEKWATDYQFEIASGNFFSADSFSHAITVSARRDKNRIIAEVPSFGIAYTWRVVCSGTNNRKKTGELHHFSLGRIPEFDSNRHRVRILKNTGKFVDNYFFVDRVLYDMEGQPVWYIPSLGVDRNPIVKDAKVSPFGTITLISDNRDILEINYNAKILWKGPDNGTVSGTDKENYHSSFVRLANGHYMVLGDEFVWWDTTRYRPDYEHYSDSVRRANPNVPNLNNQHTPFGTVIEYDSSGIPVWYWKSSAYFLHSDLVNYPVPAGAPFLDVYENAFYFDSAANMLYVGFQGISRVLKISYPGGSVLGEYGEIFKNGVVPAGNALYCGQNTVGMTTDKMLYLYNNTCDLDAVASVELLKLPGNRSEEVTKAWEYRLPDEIVDNTTRIPIPKKGRKIQRPLGGSVSELPGASLFVSMNLPYSYLYVVNRNKELLWLAVPERWLDIEKMWSQAPTYRASMITRSDLERLIWNSVEDPR